MITSLFIFGAKYAIIAVPVVAGIYFLKQSKLQQKHMAIFAAITLPLAYVVAKIGGKIYNNPRPFVVGHFAPLITHVPDNGFPSDHVLLSATIAAILYPYSKTVSVFVWILTLYIAISRVYVGVHHATDVVGSAMIAIVVAFLVYTQLKKIVVSHTS